MCVFIYYNYDSHCGSPNALHHKKGPSRGIRLHMPEPTKIAVYVPVPLQDFEHCRGGWGCMYSAQKSFQPCHYCGHQPKSEDWSDPTLIRELTWVKSTWWEKDQSHVKLLCARCFAYLAPRINRELCMTWGCQAWREHCKWYIKCSYSSLCNRLLPGFEEDGTMNAHHPFMQAGREKRKKPTSGSSMESGPRQILALTAPDPAGPPSARPPREVDPAASAQATADAASAQATADAATAGAPMQEVPIQQQGGPDLGITHNVHPVVAQYVQSAVQAATALQLNPLLAVFSQKVCC